MRRVVQLQCAVGDRAGADDLSALLIARRLAACAQVLGPITSRFCWEGREQAADEWLLLAKTTEDLAPAAVAALVAAHPYQVPEVLVTPVVGGHAPYLEWVAESVERPVRPTGPGAT